MWGDIDLKKRTIKVNRTVEKNSNKFIIKETAKSDASLRTVHIPGILAEYLSSQKREGLYVCTNTKCEMHTESSWKRMWDSYLLDINLLHGDFSEYMKTPKSKYDPEGVPFVIPRITAHWLRHTFATMLYLAGVDVVTARDQMGHSDIKTTLDIYTHLDKYLFDASQIQVTKNSKALV